MDGLTFFKVNNFLHFSWFFPWSLNTRSFLSALYCIVLYCIVMYYTVLYCIVFNVLYCIALYCIVLYCITLHCIPLYCKVYIALDLERTTSKSALVV